MSKTSQANDGRESMAWIVESMEKASGSIPAGSFGVVTKKAASQSKFESYELNEPFYTPVEITPAAGDEAVVFKLAFMGFATSKDISKSKETVDTTMDYDEATNKVTNGQVTVSGSINGMLVTEQVKGASATAANLIKSRFGTLVEVDKTGNVSRLDGATTEKDMILVAWDVRNAKENDIVAITVAPVLFTSYAVNAAYNSSETMNVSFDGSATDENNYKGIELQVTFDATLKKALPTARPTVTA